MHRMSMYMYSACTVLWLLYMVGANVINKRHQALRCSDFTPHRRLQAALPATRVSQIVVTEIDGPLDIHLLEKGIRYNKHDARVWRKA